MKIHPQSLVAIAVFAALASGCGGLRAAGPEVTLETLFSDIIYFSDQNVEIYGGVIQNVNSYGSSGPFTVLPELTPDQPTVSGFNVSFKPLPIGTQELPEAKLQCQGTTYVIPAKKIVVSGPKPSGKGVFVESALDPNGSGYFEVVLIINWPAKEFDQASLDIGSLPKSIKLFKNSSTFSTKDDQREFILRFTLRNESGEAFVLKPEHFKGLPETKNWPEIEVSPPHPQA